MNSKNPRYRARSRRAPGAMLPGSLTVTAHVDTIGSGDARVELRVGGITRASLDLDLDEAVCMARDIARSSIAYLCGDFVVETDCGTCAPVQTLTEAIDLIWDAATEIDAEEVCA